MPFQPLTQQQYQKARDAGFSADQIVQNEQKRKNDSLAIQQHQSEQQQQPKTPFESQIRSAIGGAANIATDIQKPFVSLAAKPVQYAAKLMGKQDPFAQGVPTATGNVTPSSATLEHTAGDAAQVGSYFVPGSGVLGAMGMGALQGAGQQMSQGADLPTTLVGGAEGAAVGGLAGGATKLVGAGIEKAGQVASGTQYNKALSGIKDAYSKALNLHASEKAYEGRSGHDLAQVLMEHNAPLGRTEDGFLDAGSAIEKLQAELDPLNKQAQEILQKPQGVVQDIDLQELKNSVLSRIQKLNVSQVEKNGAAKNAEDLIDAEIKQHGPVVQPHVADQIKQGFWGSSFRGNLTSSDKLQGNVAYLSGNELKKAIEESVAGTDSGDVLGELNSKRSDLVDAIKRLTKLDGSRRILGGRLGNMFGGLVGAGAAAAAHLGPLGVIGGDVFGNRASEFLNNPATRVAIAKGKAEAAGVIPKLLGKSAVPVGQAVSAAGRGVKKLARPAGLLANLGIH